jgi:hypothetical protein
VIFGGDVTVTGLVAEATILAGPATRVNTANVASVTAMMTAAAARPPMRRSCSDSVSVGMGENSHGRVCGPGASTGVLPALVTASMIAIAPAAAMMTIRTTSALTSVSGGGPAVWSARRAALTGERWRVLRRRLGAGVLRSVP